jgi:hypothetical protein
MLEFIQELFGERAGGPMKLRLILQPAFAAIFAIRAGLKDAREARPAFFWAVLTTPGNRLALLRQGWGDVGKVFILATALDVAYQIVARTGVRVLESLLVASILAFVPYLLLRGSVNRIAARRQNPTA